MTDTDETRAAEPPTVGAAGPDPDADEPSLAEVIGELQPGTGIDFGRYQQATLRRRIKKRMVARGVHDSSSYAALLRDDPAELSSLEEAVLVRVTSFFREPHGLEALKRLALPRLLELPRQSPLRVWVPGCATGEEVYSIAITILEVLDQETTAVGVKIFGTDLSASAIRRARRGTYSDEITRDVSADRLSRYFLKTDDGYRVRSHVRELCVFSVHDLTSDPPFGSIDLVSCRNLLIYFDAELQERALRLLHYSLAEPGFLLLGHAESVRSLRDFVPVEGARNLYAKKPGKQQQRSALALQNAERPLSSPASGGRRTGAAASISEASRQADRQALARFVPPGVLVNDDLTIVEFRGQTGLFLRPEPGSASLDLFRLARAELRQPLALAIERARIENHRVRRSGIRLNDGADVRTLPSRSFPSPSRTLASVSI